MNPLIKVRTGSESETHALAKAFGRGLKTGDFVCLVGGLGAGKTLFVKGIAEALGIDSHDVSSPTFTLVQQYSGRLNVYHLDIYRLDNPENDLPAIGYEEFFDVRDGVALVEWGDQAGGLLPSSRFDVHIEHVDQDNGARMISMFAIGQPGDRIDELQRNLLNANSKDGGVS